MAGVQSYRDLLIWQKSMDLCEASYRLTATFPKDELYGLTSQIRRSAVSVPANIAEGFARDSRPAFAQFIRIAQGSLKELETHLLICSRVGLVGTSQTDPLLQLADEIGRMTRAFARTLQD